MINDFDLESAIRSYNSYIAEAYGIHYDRIFNFLTVNVPVYPVDTLEKNEEIVKFSFKALGNVKNIYGGKDQIIMGMLVEVIKFFLPHKLFNMFSQS